MVFPPCVAVTVVVDGAPVPSYVGACERAGHVYAPIRPFVTQFADRVYFDGVTLVIVRGHASVRIDDAATRTPDALDLPRYELAPIARALGAALSYDEKLHVLSISLPAPTPAASPTPFDAAAPQAPPSVVFTPVPSATPRPIWTGTPLPRRTPIPADDPPR